MRTKTKAFIYISSLFALVYLLLILLFKYDETQTLYDRVSNQMYFENCLIVDNITDQEMALLEWDREAAYRISVEINEHCRLILRDTSSWTPLMLSGYYPNLESDREVAGAVVGKNVFPIEGEGDGQPRTIDVFGKKINVIGILGPQYISASDETILLFGLVPRDFSLERYKISIDSPSQKFIGTIEKQIKEECPECIVSNRETQGTARITKSSFFFMLIYIETIILAIFTLGFLVSYWHEKFDDTRKVFFLLGIPEVKVLANELSAMLLANIVGFLGAIIVGDILNIIKETKYAMTITAGVGVSVLTCLASLMLCLLVVKEKYLLRVILKGGGRRWSEEKF